MSTSLSVRRSCELETRIAHHEQQVAQRRPSIATGAAHAASLHGGQPDPGGGPPGRLRRPVAPESPSETPEDLREFVGKRIMTSKLIARVIQGFGEDETFGATRVAREANRRYRDTLKRPVDARGASVVLRRLRNAGQIHQVQSGGAAHEALYSKQRQG